MDETAIRNWSIRWPNANIGIALAPAGLVAVDCDTTDAVKEAADLGLPDTICRMSRCPAYIYKTPPGTPQLLKTHWGKSKKIDLLSTGYLVVGGEHRKGQEVYLDGDIIGPAPNWTLKVLIKECR